MGLFRNSSLEGIQSILSGYRQFRSHESAAVTWSIHKTIHGSAMGVWSRRNHEALPIGLGPWKQQEADGTDPEVLWCTSLYEVMTNSDQQTVTRQTNTTYVIHCQLGLNLYPFRTLHVSSSVCCSKTLHASFSGSFQKNTMFVFSAKRPPMYLLQQKHLIRQPALTTQLNLQRN